jgi:cytochrome P450
MTGFRSYEVYQRTRPGETTEWIKPRQLSSDAYLADPFTLTATLREHTPCYRDWPGNAFWVTRYDDVTSVFADDANFESRSVAWQCGLDRDGTGRLLLDQLDVQRCFERRLDAAGEPVAQRLVAELRGDLATEVFARYPVELLCAVLGVELTDEIARDVLLLGEATAIDPQRRRLALGALDRWTARIGELMTARGADGDDLVCVAAGLGASPRDLALALLEFDHRTLHGSVANMWCLLLTHPDQLGAVRADRRLVKIAWFEAMRHSPAVISADRFARHEVERFGRLLPDGALARVSAAGANRDPAVFDDPDRFDISRTDLCQREPRGQYRADGRPSGISFGTGAPSRHPAVPEDQPRSRYAITRDLAVTLSQVLLDDHPMLLLADGVQPTMRALRIGGAYTCWSLPVVSS